MTTKTIKTILFASIIAAMILPFSVMGIADAAPNENASDVAFTTYPDIPAAPDTDGCYHYAKGIHDWINVPCLTPEEMRDIERPTIGGSSGVYGLKDSSSTIQSYGLVDTQFSTYSGESGSQSGTPSNTWSIQTNTNQWANSGSSNTYIVQFTEQNHSTSSSNRHACVWQIKTNTPQIYASNCIAVPLQTLSSSYHGSVEGKVLSNGNLQTQYCNIAGNTQCWVVVTSDTNQLGTHWTKTSGTILGSGNSATANFVSPTSLTTKVKTGPATTATLLTDYSTLEKNNLSYGSSTTTCAFSICTRSNTLSN